MITQADANNYTLQRVTIEDLAVREDCTLETARKHVYAHLKGDKSRPRIKWTEAMRAALRADIIAGFEVHGGISAAVRKHGLGSLAHALGVLKIKSLDALRYDSVDCRIGEKLRRYKLKLVPTGLKILAGSRKPVLPLTDEERKAVIDDPQAWVAANLGRLAPLYPQPKGKP